MHVYCQAIRSGWRIHEQLNMHENINKCYQLQNTLLKNLQEEGNANVKNFQQVPCIGVC
jgi:hypothetical protein